MRQSPVAIAALFLALTSTGIAAGRMITGADVRDGSLTRADFRKGEPVAPAFNGEALRGPRGRRGPTGPQGPASVSSSPAIFAVPLAYDLSVGAAGQATGGSETSAVVEHPSTGVYCIRGVSSSRFVQAVSADPAAPTIVAAETGTAAAAAPCSSATTVRVAVFTPAGTPTDGAFHLVLS